MIDLHCHILPGIDDGAPDLATALGMARMAAADGIVVTACTPHIYPGVYDNDGPGIRAAAARLEAALREADIPLRLVVGADAHLDPELAARVRTGAVPTLGGTRYLLLEPPHHVAPARFGEFVFSLVSAGIVPVVTHPERLGWIRPHYDLFCDLCARGVWMQVTAGSLTGRFGPEARYWGERLLDEGRVHLLATDGHGTKRRPPLLAEGRQAAEKWVGAEEARHLVETRPAGILKDLPPSAMPPLPPRERPRGRRRGLWARLWSGMGG